MAKKRANRKKAPAKRPSPKPRPKAAAPRSERASRAERLDARRRARRRRSTLVRAGVVAAIAVVVLAVAMWQVTARRNAQRTIAAMTGGSCRYDARTDPGSVNEHVPNPTFDVDPPAGGLHTAAVANSGIYTQANLPGDGQVVHALEHGLIAIWYRPGIPPSDLADLEELAEDHQADVLLLPRPSLGVPIAATAWHRRLLCGELEVDSLRRFIEAYAGEGPEKVPRER